jgi:hypothetical protein
MIDNIEKCAPQREMNGAELIIQERSKQERKYTDKNDDWKDDESLAKTAASLIHCLNDDWGLYKKYRESRIKQLTVAGALLAAEIDRLQRLRRQA